MERPGGDQQSQDYGDQDDPPPPPPPGLEAMWGMEAAGAECDCPGPPPEFMLPPPPRPPILQPSDPTYCTEDPLPIETCDALPLIDASYRSSPSLQTSAVIVLCSVLGLFVFIVIVLVWKHKRKVQNFLPCKTSPQNNCDGPTAAGGIYEDLHDVIPRPTPTHHHHHHPAGGHIVAPSIESFPLQMIDVKNNIHYPSGYPMSQHPPVFLCSSPGPDPYCSQDLYNPVYEELSDADSELTPAPHSEDEFAEDELSLGGGCADMMMLAKHHRRAGRSCPLDMPPPPYRPEPPPGVTRRGRRPHEPLPPLPTSATINGGRRHRSLDRRRQEFHEGMLLDALLQLYPRVGSVEPPPPTSNHHTMKEKYNSHQRRQIPSIAQRIQCLSRTPGPYETVPVLGHLATFRPPVVPKPYSQDSAFGSDSSYSNHTGGTRSSGGRGGRGSSGRGDPRRLSQLSADLTLT